MDWLPLLSTLTGAAIGIIATLLAERSRWKHEDAKDALRLRLDTYTQYTTTVKVLGETLRALAAQEHPSPGHRAHALNEAFRTSDIATASERLWLTAPEPVIHAADTVFHCLRNIRDSYINGTPVSSPEDHTHWQTRATAAAHMRTLMRKDLGITPLTPHHTT